MSYAITAVVSMVVTVMMFKLYDRFWTKMVRPTNVVLYRDGSRPGQTNILAIVEKTDWRKRTAEIGLPHGFIEVPWDSLQVINLQGNLPLLVVTNPPEAVVEYIEGGKDGTGARRQVRLHEGEKIPDGGTLVSGNITKVVAIPTHWLRRDVANVHGRLFVKQ